MNGERPGMADFVRHATCSTRGVDFQKKMHIRKDLIDNIDAHYLIKQTLS
jgi:hypothetical protein